MTRQRWNASFAIETLLALQLMWSTSSYANPNDSVRLLHRRSAPVQFDDLVEIGKIGFDKCKKNLIESDSNRDGVVDSQEFVTFLQHEQPRTFDDVAAFQTLPGLLKVTFSTLACFCTKYGGSMSCCLGENAGINVTGTGPGTTPTVNETAYLFQVCVLTESSIQTYLSSITAPASPTPTTTPAPSVAPVSTSSKETRFPTVKPTTAATPAPTPQSSGDTSESAVETPAPTPAPSLAPPTTAPLPAQSLAPTAAPTAPNATPTRTIAPSIAPSGSVGAPATSPTSPSTVQSTGPRDRAVTSYTISVRNGSLQKVPQSNYTAALIEAMNRLAVEVGLQVFNSSTTRVRRMLETKVVTPTNITDIVSTNCPAGVSSNDTCEIVTSSVTIVFSDADNRTEIIDQYLAALNTDINRGRLQTFLTTIDPNTVVRILPESPPSPASASTPYIPSTSRSLSPGATAGIVLGSAAILLLSLVIWAVRRRRSQYVKRDVIDYPSTVAASLSVDASFENSKDAPVASTGPAALGVTQNDYGKGKTSDYDAELALGNDVIPAENVGAECVNEERLSTSTAGSSGRSLSSGWSSSASSVATNRSGLPTSGDENPDAEQGKPPREEQGISVHAEILTPIGERNRAASKDLDTSDAGSQARAGQDPDAERKLQGVVPLCPGEIWTKLAEQTKAEGDDVNASRPDEWAIARSLSAFRAAVQRGAFRGSTQRMDVHHEDADKIV